jgi:L-threonylcarbamoyladenylate synthase
MKPDLEGLTAAAKAVAAGGLICFPTDTVYGLGCDPLNPSAIGDLVKAKGGRTKAIPVLVSSLNNASELARISIGGRKLMEKFWPGPLTIIQESRGIVPRLLAPDGTVGLRSPNHVICLELLRLCSGYLVGTSANMTGHPPAVSANEAAKTFGNRVDLILDGGRSPLGIS